MKDKDNCKSPMTRLHAREKAHFRRLFENEGVSDFDDILKVLDVFLETEEHITSSQLIELLKSRGTELEPSVVRNALRLFTNFGFAKKLRFEDGKIRYEHCHLGEHHDHMICKKCGRIIEFRDDKLESIQAEVAASYGFHMLWHRMEIYGICSGCLKNRARIMPLSRAKKGERLIIEEFTGGTNARMRILSMGLKTGDAVEIITSSPRGQVVVMSKKRRYAIGRGLAEKILVKSQEPFS
ncbi:MAG: Fur family transcriptional regulator [Desulfococcus sp. 4484_241]|nr:MAG: Fur family transcriptional regulator [Desulfococcus sp. 4484_241]